MPPKNKNPTLRMWGKMKRLTLNTQPVRFFEFKNGPPIFTADPSNFIPRPGENIDEGGDGLEDNLPGFQEQRDYWKKQEEEEMKKANMIDEELEKLKAKIGSRKEILKQ